MKALVDQIKAEYEVFVTSAEAQVEKGIRLLVHVHVRLLSTL